MMRRTLGATCVSCLLAVGGFVAMGAAGYMTMTGKTLCSMVSACGDKEAKTTEAKAVAVSNKESSEKKSCCPLSATAKKGSCTGEAKVETVAAKEGSCSKPCTGEAKVETVAAKEGSCSKPCTGEAKVEAVAAKSGSCSKPCTGEAKVEAVAAKDGSCAKTCSAEKMAACAKSCEGKLAKAPGGFVIVNAAYPVVMPAAFHAASFKSCTSTFKEAGSCSSSCSGEAKTEKVAAKDASGCCKGSGVRADGQPCQKDGPHCDKAAEKTAETKKGEPVASRN